MPPPPTKETRLRTLEQAMVECLYRLNQLEREVDTLRRMIDLGERALGDVFERLAVLEARLIALNGQAPAAKQLDKPMSTPHAC